MKLNDLRKIAEAGTPDEWVIDTENPSVANIVCFDGDWDGGRVKICRAYKYKKGRHNNAAHIATFSPKTVLALLDIIEKQHEAMEHTKICLVQKAGELVACYVNLKILAETNKLMEEIK